MDQSTEATADSVETSQKPIPVWHISNGKPPASIPDLKPRHRSNKKRTGGRMIGPPVPSDLDQASSATEHDLTALQRSNDRAAIRPEMAHSISRALKTFRRSQAQRSLLHSAAIQQLQSLHTASDAAAEQLPSNSACPAPPSFGRSEGHGGAVPVAFGSIEIHVLP